MTTWAVLASGPSMSQSVADSVNGRCKVVAVSDVYRLAPWADVLVSTDAAWWLHHQDALKFSGPKIGAMPDFRSVEGVGRFPADSGTNSGLLGVMVAVHFGATRVLLCGVDMHSAGDHFFGKHPAPLKTTPPGRMEIFKRQFAAYRPKGVEIINCTPGSALRVYRMGNLEHLLSQPALLVA